MNTTNNRTKVIDGQVCRRHVDPDGSIGGWVAQTATVAPTAYLGPDALNLDNAEALDNAVVQDSSKVSHW